MQPEFFLKDITPIILAGGSGTRLRPLTAPGRPKPFLRPFGRYSLLQETLLRGRLLGPPMIVTHRDHGLKARQEAQAAGIARLSVLHEPAARGTAAALGCAAYALLRRRGHDACMLVMPSDHYVADAQSFMQTMRLALPGVAADEMVLIAAPARSADTRYGYISVKGSSDPARPDLYRLCGFVEKPSPERTRALLRAGMSFWNTGIFACRARVFWDRLQHGAPAIARACARAMEKGAAMEGDDIYPQAGDYAKIPAQVVDRAVMEHLEGAVVAPLQTTWQDIGCWPALLRVKMERLVRGDAATSLGHATQTVS